MKIFIFFISILIISRCNVFCQIPNIEWQKTYGGSENDEGYSICHIQNGEYAIAGISNSSNGYINNSHGYQDVWLIIIDSIGYLKSNKCFGGSLGEEAVSNFSTFDSCYILAGNATADVGDVSGAHGGGFDFWVLKVDQNGNLQWQKCLGGSSYDEAFSIVQTKDNGYIVCGVTGSYDFDVQGMHGGQDMFVVKLNHTGIIEWTKALGGTDYEQGNSCMQLLNGNYVVAGSAASNNGNVSGLHSNSTDVWVVELDSSGNLLRQKCFGGSSIDNAFKVLPAPNSGLYIAAVTSSTDGDVSGNHGGTEDFWLIRTDSSWNIQWQKCYGGLSVERAKSACLTPDGGVIVVGHAGLDDGQVNGNNGGAWPFYSDYWVVKTDSLGNFEWGKCLGGSGEDVANDIKQTSDGGYIIVGTTASNDSDVTGNNGMQDVWVVKLSNPTIGIQVPENGIMEFSASQMNDKILIRFFSKKNKNAMLNIYDLNGRLISEKNIKITDGINYYEQQLAGFSSGIYVVEILDKEIFQSVKIFVNK